MVYDLYSELKVAEKIEPRCIIGTVCFNQKNNRFYDFNYEKRIDEHLFRVNEIISSGTLSPVKIAGAYKLDNNLFIDYVDSEWCWRLRSNGIGIYLTTKTYLNHQLGSGIIDLKFLKLPHCTPVRAYYITRNIIILSFRKYTPQRWKIKAYFKLITRLFLFPILFKPRREYLRNMLKGISDGLKQK
ncbi:MAG: hypothetical protein LUD02_02390 [Tannerellaceae bacterium]|nr:hypothetical protein [Tannerellaceae bacterium]